MQRNTLIGIVVLVLILVVGYFLATQNQRQQTTTTLSPTQSPTTQPTAMTDQEDETDDAMMKKEAKTFEISGKNFDFSKQEIRVNKGDTVKIVFTSTGGLHDWTVDEFDAKTAQVNTGSKAEVEFVADEVGTFEYYCSVGNHRAMGMVGNLIVE